MFCAKCQTQFPATSICPRCSSRLLSPGEVTANLSNLSELPPLPLQTTVTGRVLVGSILALGLHLALREWGAFLGLFDDANSSVAYVAGYSLRIVAAMVGGFFAGAGRSNSLCSGAAIGLLSGLGWLVVDSYPNLQLDALNVGLVMGMVGVAGACALAGGRIWPAIVELPEFESPRRSSLLKFIVGGKKPNLTPPTRWARLLVSSLAVLIVVMGADGGRALLKKLPLGTLNLGGQSAIPLVDFQIAFVGIVLCGLIAGASTGAGLRHGIIAGFLAAFVVVAAYTQQPPDHFACLEYVLDKVSARESTLQSVVAIGVTIATTVAISGWIGGQLFPRLRKQGRRKTDY